MPATKATYTKFISHESIPLHGLTVGSKGTTVIVANTNALQAQSGPLDPWDIAAGNDTNGANVRPIGGLHEYLYLETFFVYANYDDAVSTDPVIRVYGKVPNPPGGGDRRWPSDDDSTNFEDVTSQGFWIPLTTADIAPQISKTMDGGILTQYAASGNTFAVVGGNSGNAGPVRWYTAGCSQAMVVVATAGVGPDAGVILARGIG